MIKDPRQIFLESFNAESFPNLVWPMLAHFMDSKSYGCQRSPHRRLKLKSSRIANWKSKIKDASKSTAVRPLVYRYLRKKVQKRPANIIEEDGNIVVDPTDALRTFASKWDSIFSANLLLPRNEQVLRPVIPFIEQVRRDVSLLELTAMDFSTKFKLAERMLRVVWMDGPQRNFRCFLLCALSLLCSCFAKSKMARCNSPQF